jgi:hypothetical protein
MEGIKQGRSFHELVGTFKLRSGKVKGGDYL